MNECVSNIILFYLFFSKSLPEHCFSFINQCSKSFYWFYCISPRSVGTHWSLASSITFLNYI